MLPGGGERVSVDQCLMHTLPGQWTVWFRVTTIAKAQCISRTKLSIPLAPHVLPVLPCCFFNGLDLVTPVQ